MHNRVRFLKKKEKSFLSSRQRGFTLIELLVVVMIIGVLSSVALASLTSAREKSRDAKRVAQIVQISRALESYYDSTQSYPSTTPTLFVGEDAGIQILAAKGFLPPHPIPPPGSDATYLYRGVYGPLGAPLECGSLAPSGTVCGGYELGITLERADNVVLDKDADQSVGTFFGGGTECLTGGAGDERCHDIKP